MTLEEKKDLLKLAITRVIRGEGTVEFPMMGMDEVDQIMKDRGFEQWEGNWKNEIYCGWEGDFWFHWIHPEYGGIAISGGVWQRGDTYKIYKDEKDTTEEGD